MVFLKFFLIATSIAGFLLTLYISRKKHSHEKMVCPIGGTCESVMHSRFSTFFGLPIEYIGLAYYSIIFAAYTLFFFASELAHPLAVFLLLGVTIAAFLFSAYLTFIQAFTLREWCTLCLTSAGLCTVIFVTAILVSNESLPSLLRAYELSIDSAHMFALSIGLGAATLADIFFLKFLRDFHISESEHDTLTTVSQVTWFALAVIILSGAGLVIARGGFAAIHPPQQLAWLSLLVIIVISAFLYLKILPRLIHISAGEKHDHEAGELRSIHRFIFISGAVSLTSWYTMFFLEIIGGGGASFETLLTLYGAALIGAGIAGRIMEYALSKNRVH